MPRVLVTDKLASYQVAHREVLPSVTHRRSKDLNNRVENSHQPTRIRERAMKRFASPGQAQRFLFAFSHIRQHFRPRRHLISAPQWRTEMTNRFAVWDEIASTQRSRHRSRSMWWFEASPRRATPKGRQSFISCTAPHQQALPTSSPLPRSGRTLRKTAWPPPRFGVTAPRCRARCRAGRPRATGTATCR